MRTVTFKSVYESITRMHGMDPRGDAVSSDTGLSISDNLNARVQTAWFAWEWPEWTITEERAFRQIWNNSRQFYQAGADGKPDEVFYIPNVADHSLVDAGYYRVLEDLVNPPPIGTLPTDTAYWEPMDTVDTYVEFDQVCRRRIGEVLDVYANNPAVCKPPRCLNHRPTENGIQIYEAGGLLTVFVRYLIPAEQFTTFPYIPSRTYLRGDTVYVAGTGECYQAIVTGTGHDPATEYSYWRRCLFPAVLAQYVQLGTYGDCLLESDTSDERDPVMLQIRGQNASRARSDAEDEINRQINRLQSQGQNFQYLPFGVVVGKAARGSGAFYSVPGYVLQGGGAYAYGPIAPTGSGVTTIDDRCETAWGYIPPPPPEPGPGAGGEISGSTPLINGQGYIDVVFDTAERNSYWTFIECQVVNTIDPAPLNIWPGIVTSKTKTGFRLQLNGIPDSNNYSLSWTIKEPAGDTVESVTYLFSGPTSGVIGTPTGFTVMLPPGTVVPAPVTVTPSDGGAGGTFAPTSVELTTDLPTATFTYTPASYGAITLSVTNDRGLEDPSPRTFTSLASTYTLSGPGGGAVGLPSTNFTVALPAGGAVVGTATVTPHDGGGGTFTPTTVALTTGVPSATFTYTPASAGTKTISVTNDGGLVNPANISYIVTAPFSPADIAGLKLWLKADALALSDGAAVATWPDSSGSGHNFTQATGANQPLFKTSIINGKPVLRFDGSNDYLSNSSVLIPTTSSHYTVISVVKPSATAVGTILMLGSTAGVQPNILAHDTTQWFAQHNSGSGAVYATDATLSIGTPTVVAWDWNGLNIHLWRDGTLKNTTGTTTVLATTNNVIGYDTLDALYPWTGDIAEVLFYDSSLSATDRVNVENYLGAKYGITIVPTLRRIMEERRDKPAQTPKE